MITVARGRFGSAAARVLEQVRAGGVVSRDEVVARTGLSPATVGRVAAQLVDARVLRERPDRVRPGAVGRPGVPVEVDPTHFVTVGIHIGRRTATVALGDLTGRAVTQETVAREPGADPDLDELSRVAARLLGGLPGRAPLSAGLVAPWRDLGIAATDAGAELHRLTGLDVRTGDHIAAITATEFFHRRHGADGVTLYVYARNSVGFAVVVDKGTHTEVSRAGSLTHFPSGSGSACGCGRTGCLEVSVTDDAVARAAHDAGLVSEATIEAVYAADTHPVVAELLAERGRRLGRTAAVVRDMITPDRVVLLGQAFTGYTPVLGEITAAFVAATALPRVEVSFTRLGSGLQATTACTIGLGAVYDEPLALVPTRRRTESASA
jgi:predicted NBD/HSP70 family sugar kinase